MGKVSTRSGFRSQVICVPKNTVYLVFFPRSISNALVQWANNDAYDFMLHFVMYHFSVQEESFALMILP